LADPEQLNLKTQTFRIWKRYS